MIVPRTLTAAAIGATLLVQSRAVHAQEADAGADAAPTASAAPSGPAPDGGAPPAPSIVPPVVLTHVDAVYPPSALAQRTHADVVLLVTVGADGRVTNVEVARSGGKDVDDAAIVAAKQWTFSPAKRNGEPVASRIRIPFHFAPPEAAPQMIEGEAPGDLPVQPAVQPAPAQAPAAAPAPAEAAPTAEDVTVRGRIAPREHGTSDYQISVGQLAVVPRKNASDMLKLAPGILLTNEGGEGHAEQVFLRGFDAREGQDLEFTVDGVPINDAGNLHGNGYADTHFILPELVHSLRVVEGPYAPQQGNFAVAGSADYQLGLERRGLTTKYTTGSYGTQRLLLTWGPKDLPTGTFAGAEYYTTNGFGQNRQARRGSAIGQYEGDLGGGTYRVTAQAHHTDFNSAGIMREDDYDTGRKGFFDTEDPNQVGNTASRYSIAIAYERHKDDTDFTQQLFLIQRQMRLLEDFTGFVNDVQEPMQELHGQRGDLLDLEYQGTTIGARGSARWRGKFLELPQELELGYFARGDKTTSTQDRLQASNNAPYKRDVDLDSTLGDIGLYADANVKFLPWLGFRGGVRADMFMFDVLNNCAVQNTVDFPRKSNPEIDQSCLTQQEHGVYREPSQRSSTGSGAIMPRGTILVGPFEHVTLSGSYGEGVRSIDPIYVSQGYDTPFVSAQSEDVGLSYAKTFESFSVSARGTLFRTHVDRDLVFNETEGRNTLSNGSTRTGFAAAARFSGSFFDEAANVTGVRAKFDDTGLDVPYVPNLVVRSDTALFHELPWLLAHEPLQGVIGYGLSYVGPRALPYNEKSETIFLSDASVALRWTIWEVSLVTTNLFGVRYRLGEYNYVSDFHSMPQPTLVPSRTFTAGAPREVFLSLAATFGGT
jgi:TonB family protein